MPKKKKLTHKFVTLNLPIKASEDVVEDNSTEDNNEENTE